MLIAPESDHLVYHLRSTIHCFPFHRQIARLKPEIYSFLPIYYHRDRSIQSSNSLVIHHQHTPSCQLLHRQKTQPPARPHTATATAAAASRRTRNSTTYVLTFSLPSFLPISQLTCIKMPGLPTYLPPYLDTNPQTQAILTPINFITFLLSLYLVDCRYEDERARRHAAGRSARGPGEMLLPTWLHRVLFSPQPYEWVDQRRTTTTPTPGPPNPPNRNDERYYYHTKQRKLMKMEAADAFGLRTPVLLALSLTGAVAAWAAWRLGWGVVSWVAGSLW